MVCKVLLSGRLLFTNDCSAFPVRDGQEHRRRAAEYHTLPDEKTRAEFFKEHSVRYFELSRLTYFDPVRMTVIDPMHNILLGKQHSL